MNIEKLKLEEMEKSGKFVFHGSPFFGIEVLKPKQGKHFPNPTNVEEFILDGDPAVSATPYADFAIFRALINRENLTFTFRSGFGLNKDGEKEFRLSTKDVIKEIKNKSGFVYVFNKSDFKPYSRNGKAHEGNMEWRAYHDMKPVYVIKVEYEDLKQIEPLIQFTDAN